MPSPNVSFEFFPPKTDKMQATLWASIDKIAPLSPTFVSVTYGAGGSTRERTHATVEKIISETDIPVAAHLTTVNATREDVDAVLADYWSVGVRHIVALRGDPPEGVGAQYVPTEGGYENAAALTSAARALNPFEVTVGCYPETHPESGCPQADIDMLKRKIDAGATRAITQFFYDNDVYMRFVDRARAAGITIPIIPGIMPVTKFSALQRMAKLCGTTIPDTMVTLFENLDADPETCRLVSATVAAEQCRFLADQGVNDFHFYTLNRADLSYATCHLLGLRTSAKAAA